MWPMILAQLQIVFPRLSAPREGSKKWYEVVLIIFVSFGLDLPPKALLNDYLHQNKNNIFIVHLTETSL